jgi:lipoyl(octanoyl) transferase
MGQDPKFSAGPTPLQVRRLGRVSFEEAHKLQAELVSLRAAGEISDQLLFCEHEPVVTVGRSPRSEQREQLEKMLDVPIFEVERGGEATWHGPGQLVAYPLRLLPHGERDLHAYLRDLEGVVIDTLADFGVVGRREEGLTGVWIGAQKVASIGIAVRRWVTWHGLALNLSNSTSGFSGFHPCGLDANVMTRLSDHVGKSPAMEELQASLEGHFRARFGYL